jgi:hypothetical protein
MGWKDFLEEAYEKVLPWFGFNRVHDADRSWTLKGAEPPEHGWFRFSTPGGRVTTLLDPTPLPLDPTWGESQKKLKGYVVGDRFIPDDTRVNPGDDPIKLIEQTLIVHCVEPGLERVSRSSAVVDREGRLVYHAQEFPLGPEDEVIRAYQNRAENLDKIQGVIPALDLAFRFISFDRLYREKRREELRKLQEKEAKERAEKERLNKLMKDAGSAVGRRILAAHDFDTAAREALRVSGAEFLDARPSRNKGEMVVQFRFQKRGFECVVAKHTLRVIDAGVCLTDHATGQKGDTFFTLESLPGVMAEAMRRNKLVVWRHIDRDDDGEEIDWYE